MKRDEIVATLQQEYTKLTSLKVMAASDDDNTIILEIRKYRNGDNYSTARQCDYIFSLPNARRRSNSCVYQMNKWCASAVIDICKHYPDTKFYICK